VKKSAKGEAIDSGKVGSQSLNLVSCCYCKHLLQFVDSIMPFMMAYTHFPHFSAHEMRKAHFGYNLYTTTTLFHARNLTETLV
jgi:hypothetical protein